MTVQVSEELLVERANVMAERIDSCAAEEAMKPLMQEWENCISILLSVHDDDWVVEHCRCPVRW